MGIIFMLIFIVSMYVVLMKFFKFSKAKSITYTVIIGLILFFLKPTTTVSPEEMIMTADYPTISSEN